MRSFRQKLGSVVTLAKGFADFVKDPADMVSLHDMQTGMEGLSTPEAVEKILKAFRSASGFSELLAHRYQAPPWQREDLSHFPPDTLGHALYHFMIENGLSRESLNNFQNETDMGYLHRRGQETHDIWHTVVGYRTDILGELALHSFLMGQLFSYVKSERVGTSFFVVAIEVGLLAHIFIHHPHLARQSLEQARDGLRRGLIAPPLWAVRWEEMWSRPLSDVRSECLGAAARS